MKIDPKFTAKIQAWLNADESGKEHVIEGAQLLVQINPKNVSYRRFLNLALTRPEKIEAKIRYELKTHLRYRLDGLTLEEVNRLDRTVIPETAKIISMGAPETPDTDDVRVSPCPSDAESPEAATEGADDVSVSPCSSDANTPSLGRRDDHDSLPDDIQKLWEENAELYKDIKALFEELKAMEDLPSCQRYDKLQILAAKDERYRKNFAAYDAAYPAPSAPAETPETPDTDEVRVSPSSSAAENPAAAAKDADEVRVSPCSSAAENPEAAAKDTDEVRVSPCSSAAETPAPAAISSARSYITKNLPKLKTLIDEKKDATKLRENIQQRVNILVSANAVMKQETINVLKTFGIVFHEQDEEPTAAPTE